MAMYACWGLGKVFQHSRVSGSVIADNEPGLGLAIIMEQHTGTSMLLHGSTSMLAVAVIPPYRGMVALTATTLTSNALLVIYAVNGFQDFR